MQITLNGKDHSLDKETRSLAEFLLGQGIDHATGRVAVALNEKVALRKQWNTLFIQEGDRIEIIHAVQGG